MSEHIKNHGIDLEREEQEISQEDWVFGSQKLSGIAENISFIDRCKYLPKGEVQRGKEDMMDCASRGPINILEFKLNYLYQNNLLHIKNRLWLEQKGYVTEEGLIELSDAFIAILSNTTRHGNSLKGPVHATHEYGVIPKQLLPLDKGMTWSEYHRKSRITKDMLKLGEEFLSRFSINYERVLEKDFNKVVDKDLIDVAGYAWPQPNGDVYPRVEYRHNHVFVYFEKPIYKIFDNYRDSFDGDFIKRLATNYSLYKHGYRIIINEKESKDFNGSKKTKKHQSIWSKLWQNLKSLFN